jgi:hypothetical protein
MDQINMMIGQIRRMKVRQLTQQAINFGLVVASALMIWKSLMLGTSFILFIIIIIVDSQFVDFQCSYWFGIAHCCRFVWQHGTCVCQKDHLEFHFFLYFLFPFQFLSWRFVVFVDAKRRSSYASKLINDAMRKKRQKKKKTQNTNIMFSSYW